MNGEEARSLLSVAFITGLAFIIAFAGSQGSVLVGGIPLFGISISLIFIIQWIAFIPAYLNRTERFFDLTGSITYISVVILAGLLNPNHDMRTLLLSLVVIVWAGRLGSFLFKRIIKVGEDRRFKEIRRSFKRFLSVWTLQGLWVSLTLGAALAAITSEIQVALGFFAYVGFLVWLLGFSIELVADNQKRKFLIDPANKGKFINSGLWAWSRHPNYFGEIVLWIGVTIIALPVLYGWQLLMLISPVFVIVLLTKISGIPLLEKRADEKWGGQEEYELYKKSTPILIPQPKKDK